MKNLLPYAVLVAGTTLGGWFLVGAYFRAQDDRFIRIFIEHTQATVGLPAAAITALFIVVFLEQKSGPIEMEGWGLKFKGAAGPVVLWVMTFLSIAGAIRLVWGI